MLARDGGHRGARLLRTARHLGERRSRVRARLRARLVGADSSTSSSASGVELALAAAGGTREARAARLLRFLPRPADDPDVLDDRRGDRVRRARARRRRAEVPQHDDDAGLHQGSPSLRAQRRAPGGAIRSHAHRRRGLPRLHRAAPGRLRERGRRARHRVHRASRRPSCASTPTTCFCASTATRPAAPPQPKPIDMASKSIEHAGSSVRIVVLPAGEDPDSFVRDARRRSVPAPARRCRAGDRVQDRRGNRAGFGPDSTRRRRLLPKAEALVRALAPREEWDRWRVYVAGRLQVSVDDLRNSRFLADRANFAPSARAAFARKPSRHGARSRPLSFEREVVSILLEEPSLGRRIRRAHRRRALPQRRLPANLRTDRWRRPGS